MSFVFNTTPNHGYKIFMLAVWALLSFPFFILLADFPYLQGPQWFLFLFSAPFPPLFYFTLSNLFQGLSRKRRFLFSVDKGILSWTIEDELPNGRKIVFETFSTPISEIRRTSFSIHLFSGTYNFFSMVVETDKGLASLSDNPLGFSLTSISEAERLLSFYRRYIER